MGCEALTKVIIPKSVTVIDESAFYGCKTLTDAFIRKTIADKYGKEVAENTSILYGGSCKPSNAAELFAKPDVCLLYTSLLPIKWLFCL